MTPAFAIRVLDALADGAASRAHDGVHLVAPWQPGAYPSWSSASIPSQ
jgi:hypothetical protein